MYLNLRLDVLFMPFSTPPPISILAVMLQYAPYVNRKVMFYGVLTHRHVSVIVSDIRRVGDGIDGGPSMT